MSIDFGKVMEMFDIFIFVGIGMWWEVMILWF